MKYVGAKRGLAWRLAREQGGELAAGHAHQAAQVVLLLTQGLPLEPQSGCQFAGA